MRRALLALGMLWTAPNTLIGVAIGLGGLPFGARATLRPKELAVVFQDFPWGPGGAVTLGNAILHTGHDLATPCRTYAHQAGQCSEAPILLSDHERAHVLQAMVLGPLFLPLYLVSGGVHVRNRFERAADRYARMGRGWWPWWRRDDERSPPLTSR